MNEGQALVEATRAAGHVERADARRVEALVALGQALAAEGYRFTCVTPDTHALVNARPDAAVARDLRGVFGWSRPFAASLLPPSLFGLLDAAQALDPCGSGLWKSRVRFASFDGGLVVHSSWPTLQNDAVFFGPDTYRFVALIRRVLNERPMRATRIVDIGCGSGAGGIAAARAVLDGAEAEVLFTDINPEALQFAQVSARLADLTRYRCLASDVLQALPGPLDLVVANPPYMCDAQRRAYRHGGDGLGIALSLRIVAESLPKLAPGGRLVLYTGAPSVGGVDMLAQALEPLLAGVRHDYVELDPDVFGSELQQPAYADVERIAVVGLVLDIA